MDTENPNTRPVVLLMYALTFTSGIIDAVTILGLGDIFASLMTGNIVFIGLGLGGFEDVSPLRNALAIIAFILGSAAAGWVAKKFAKKRVGSWLLVVCLIEVIFLMGAAWSAWDMEADGVDNSFSVHVMIAIGLASFAMGLRNSTVLRLSISDLKVTVLTLAISGFGADLGAGKSERTKQVRRLASIFLIGSGAAFGAWLFFRYGVAISLCMIASLVFLATIGFNLSKEAKLTLDKLQQ